MPRTNIGYEFDFYTVQIALPTREFFRVPVLVYLEDSECVLSSRVAGSIKVGFIPDYRNLK
jgi:hypothetical protein